MDNTIANLRFNNNRYRNWQTVDMQLSVDDLCMGMRLSIVGPGTGESLGLNENTVIDVLMDDDKVGTVRPDDVRRRVGADSHGITIQARSLARELVDCQFSKSMSGLKLGEIVKRLGAEFKVPVTIDAETAAVPDFSMQCESPANALINAVRAADLLLYPLASGGLILTKPTSAPPVAVLEFGINIVEYEVVDEYKLRFSEYVVKGFDYEEDAPRRGKAKDSGFQFFRPMHLVADRYSQGLGGCERRAQLERNRREARAKRIELHVNGWRFLNGKGVYTPWELNTQVRVIIPEEGIDAVFMIGDLNFRFDPRSGDITSMTVMPREAFVGQPTKGKKGKKGAGVRENLDEQ